MNKKITNWNNQVVWMVGASDGIGASLSKLLLKEGATVFLSSRRKEKLEEVATGYSKARVLPLDVLDLNSLTAAMETISSQTKVDLIIYMAADYAPIYSGKIDADTAGRIIDINFKGAVNLSSVAIPFLLKQKRGHFSLVASIAGLIGLPKSSVYGATKAALINFGESLYFDLKPMGLDISVVNPGFVKTRLTEKNDFEMPSIMTAEMAALEIKKGYESGKFAIIFPFAFSLFFRFLRILPYPLHFKLMKSLVKT